jgi:hypothetical protein
MELTGCKDYLNRSSKNYLPGRHCSRLIIQINILDPFLSELVVEVIVSGFLIANFEMLLFYIQPLHPGI